MVKNYIQAKNVWVELISGVVFKERLRVYESFLEYTKTKKYLDFERHEYGEFDDDAIKIIADIKADKTMTADGYGTPIEIHSIDELESTYDDYFLVREPNKLFKIVKGKTVDEILKSTTENHFAKDRARVSMDTVLYVSEGARDYNFTVLSNNQYVPVDRIYGTAVFGGCNELGEMTNISVDEMIDIIQRMKFFLGDGVLDLRI